MLQSSINDFTEQYSSAKPFQLAQREWKQIEYLIDITKLFNFFTTTIGKTKDPTICYVFDVYTGLFQHLHQVKRALKKKKYSWVSPILQGVDKAIEKLNKYFDDTYFNLGSIYGIGTILAPSHRLSPFERGGSWLSETESMKTRYEIQLRRLYKREYVALSKSIPSALPTSLNHNRLSLFVQNQNRKRKLRLDASEDDDQEDNEQEIDAYLAQGKFIVIFVVINFN